MSQREETDGITISAVVHPQVFAWLKEMEGTGLYGRSMADVVEGLVLKGVREYLGEERIRSLVRGE